MSINETTGSSDHAFMRHIVLEPFSSIRKIDTYASQESKLEALIHNLEAHHKAVRNALFCQVFSDVDHSRHAQEPAPPPPPPTPAMNTLRHQSDEAVLSSLHTRWNPRAPKPVLSPNSQPHGLSHSHAQQLSRFQSSSKGSSLQSVDAALSKLVAYDQYVAKVMEDKYAARERYKVRSEGMEDRKAPGSEETKDRTLSYDPSRDPRLRK